VSQEVNLPTWPGGARVAVSLTFDVDGDPSLMGWAGSEYARRLSSLSYFRYGPTRGLQRILAALAARSITATFYVPGATALKYPDAVLAILEAGHELGHHGHEHLRSHTVTLAQQRAEIELGLEAHEQVSGKRPLGYRSPAAELTSETLHLLNEYDFAYDSSCMGDDRPYIEEADGASILELPIEWYLDDAPYLFFLGDLGGQLVDPRSMVEQWWAEFALAVVERRLLTLVMHPEITGRGSRVGVLGDLLDRMADHADVWFAPHGRVAELLSWRGEGDRAG